LRGPKHRCGDRRDYHTQQYSDRSPLPLDREIYGENAEAVGAGLKETGYYSRDDNLR